MSQPKRQCPHCGAVKVGLEDHIRDKHSRTPLPLKVREFELICPECGAPLKLKKSKYGVDYACTRRDTDGCKGSHGAHPDGTPLGVPADQRTKRLRMVAHNAFDPLWKGERASFASRGEAYLWMQITMGMNKHEAHISRFGRDDCKKLVEAIWQQFGD